MTQVLIIDDDVALCRSLQIILKREGHDVHTVNTGKRGLAVLEQNSYDLIFVDLDLPDLSGLEVIKSSAGRGYGLTVMITGVQDSNAGIQAIQFGAFDYVRKPLDRTELLSIVESARRFAAGQNRDGSHLIPGHSPNPHEIIGSHPKTTNLIKQVALFARSRVPVLIQGETGTGKELVARALHETACPDTPFMAVNCSAVVPTLLESELFGHVRGAFTGADADKSGKLELAGTGTVFFDEVGDMSYDLQAKLLRVIQEREFERVGSAKLLPFKARVIAATHRDLKKMVRDGIFREDLYYRIAVSAINVPSLRERRSDIQCLVEHALSRLSEELGKEICSVDDGAIRRCLEYDWPGNVRELNNVLTRAALLARGTTITVNLIDTAIEQTNPIAPPLQELKALRDVECEYIYKALLSNQWNIKRTARLLDISPVTLRKKIRDYQLARPPTESTRGQSHA
jgi:two-component system response regulator AtoC